MKILKRVLLVVLVSAVLIALVYAELDSVVLDRRDVGVFKACGGR